jgi:hypothetical protein
MPTAGADKLGARRCRTGSQERDEALFCGLGRADPQARIHKTPPNLGPLTRQLATPDNFPVLSAIPVNELNHE